MFSLIFSEPLDLDWVDDGTRYFSKDEDRKRFHDKVVAELEKRNLPYVLISGKGSARLHCAEQALKNLK